MSRTRSASPLLAALAGALILAGCPGCPGDKAPAVQPPAPAPPSPSPDPAPARTPDAVPAPSTGKGTISGRVTLAPTNKTPPSEPLPVTKDPEVCGATHNPASLVLGANRGVKNVVVFLRGIAAPADWNRSGNYVVDQVGCHFTPRIMIVPEGQKVVFTSSDAVLHNVRLSSTLNGSVNESVPAHGKFEKLFEKHEFIGVGCSVHPFMGGAVVVANHPWFVLTDADGAFTLPDVPAGTYKLIAWHEVLAKVSKEGTPVTVTAGQPATVDLTYP